MKPKPQAADPVKRLVIARCAVLAPQHLRAHPEDVVIVQGDHGFHVHSDKLPLCVLPVIPVHILLNHTTQYRYPVGLARDLAEEW